MSQPTQCKTDQAVAVWSRAKASMAPANLLERQWEAPSAGTVFQRWARATCYVFNLHNIVVTALTCALVYVCNLYDIKWNMDFALIATGTTFPLVITISQAFQRRERATILLAHLKATVVALFYMHRDWDRSEGDTLQGDNSHKWAQAIKAVLQELLGHMKNLLVCPRRFESIAEKRLAARGRTWTLFLNNHKLTLSTQGSCDRFKKYESRDPSQHYLLSCYKSLSQLSVMNEQLTNKAGYTKAGEGGMSRSHQYLRFLMTTLEELRMIRDYRTPTMMRHACGVLLHLFAVGLAPYFSHFCDAQWEEYGHSKGSCPAGFTGAICYTSIVMLLYHIQTDLEQPFDMEGLDDIFFELAEELEDVAGPMGPSLTPYASMAADLAKDIGGADGMQRCAADTKVAKQASPDGSQLAAHANGLKVWSRATPLDSATVHAVADGRIGTDERPAAGGVHAAEP